MEKLFTELGRILGSGLTVCDDDGNEWASTTLAATALANILALRTDRVYHVYCPTCGESTTPVSTASDNDNSDYNCDGCSAFVRWADAQPQDEV